MKKLIWFLALAVLPTFASAAYDDSWYKADFWSGEYPNGFAVVADDVSLPARTAPDKDLAATLSCALPKNAVYHHWNASRPAEFVTYSKITPMYAKEDFVFDVLDDGAEDLSITKGQLIEHLVYGAEGMFFVRIDGKTYEAYQDLYDHLEPVDVESIAYDQWVKISCGNKVEGWILYADLVSTDEEGNETYLPGLDSWYLGFHEYGDVTDIQGE